VFTQLGDSENIFEKIKNNRNIVLNAEMTQVQAMLQKLSTWADASRLKYYAANLKLTSLLWNHFSNSSLIFKDVIIAKLSEPFLIQLIPFFF